MVNTSKKFDNMDKDNIKAGLTIEQVWEYCTGLGMEGTFINDNELVFQTACHNPIGQGKRKLFYYQNTRLFKCYTGCGELFDIFELIRKIYLQKGKEVTLEESINLFLGTKDFYLEDPDTGISYEDSDGVYQKPVFSYFDKKVLYKLKPAIHLGWEKEGISRKTQRKYGIRYDPLREGAIIPHLSPAGFLLGIQERFLSEETPVKVNGKYMPYRRGDLFYSSPSSQYLFGVHENQSNIRYRKKAMVFEGEKSVMLADDIMGEENNFTVASFGMRFSRHQFEALVGMGVEEITIAFDRQFKDIMAENAISSEIDREFLNLVRFFLNVETWTKKEHPEVKMTYILDVNKITDYKDAPLDCGIEIFHKLYTERKTFDEIVFCLEDMGVEIEW